MLEYFKKYKQWTHEYFAIRQHIDTEFYLARNPQLKRIGGNAALHYIQRGTHEGKRPTPDFDTEFYLRENPDVRNSGLNPFFHYLKFGRKEGRRANNFEKASNHQVIKKERNRSYLLQHLPSRNWNALRSRTGLDAKTIALRQNQHSLASRLWYLVDACEPAIESEQDGGPDLAFVNYALRRLDGRVLSLDIWDTLLRRDCHPDEIKLRSARAVWLLKARECPGLTHLHPCDLFQMRRIAEATAANEDYEYRFDEAAKAWLDLIGSKDPTGVQTLVSIEERIERAAAYRDPTIFELLERHEGRVICVSDFYLPSTSLSKLLVEKGVTSVAKVYSSSDELKTKRSGNLYDLVLATERLSPERLLHIGDREQADVEQALSRQIDALHFDSPHDHTRAETFGEYLRNHLDGNDTYHSAALLRLTGAKSDLPLPMAALAIPVCGFVLSVLEEACRRGMDKMFFFTREGAFFKRAYERLVEQDVFDLGTYPEARILEVSRRATFAASLTSFSVKELMRVWNQYSSQSLRALAVTLNIDPEAWLAPAAVAGLTLDEVIEHPWQDQRVHRFLKDNLVREGALATIREQRAALFGYLEAAGFAPTERKQRMVVDIGWRGTIQDNLSYLINGSVHGCYFGLERFLNGQSNNTTKSAYLMDKNVAADFSISEPAALEFLFNSPGGSVIGYQNGAPQRHILAGEESVIEEGISCLQSEIFSCLVDVIGYVRRHGLVSQDLRTLSRFIVNDYVSDPPQSAAEAFFDLEHNETFGTGLPDELAGDHGMLRPAARLAGPEFHKVLSDYRKTARWPEALRHGKPLSDLILQSTVEQKLALPVRLGGPAILPSNMLDERSIAILAPRPIKGSGGHRTIYNLAQHLSLLGYDVHLMHEAAAGKETEYWVEDILGTSSVRVYNIWDSSVTVGAAVATIDYSAFCVREFWAHRTKTFYLIQDLEAHFNPVGDTFLRSERSYTNDTSNICIGRWLPHLLKAKYGVNAASAGLGVDHNVYFVDQGIEKKNRVAVLLQPEKFRRAPELCMAALALLKQMLPQAEIVVFGSSSDIRLPFDCQNRGLISNLNEINALYNEAKVGLCISSTNPSRIPFEMMAAGCVPVDIYRYNNLFDYASGTCLLAYQSPDSLAQAMYSLLVDDHVWNQRRQKGLEVMSARTLDWEMDIAANTIGWVLQGGDLSEVPVPTPSYRDAPIISDSCDNDAVRKFLDYEWRLAVTEPAQ